MYYLNKYYEGVFWLAQNKTQKITGTLYIDNNGIAILTSLQSLTQDKTLLFEWGNIGLIVGYIIDPDHTKTYSIKMYESYKAHQSIGPLNLHKYKSQNAFIFERYDKGLNENYYNAVMINSGSFNDWVPVTGYNVDFNNSDDFKISQLYNQPKSIDLFGNDDYNIYVYFRANVNYPSVIYRESHIKEDVFINIETTKHFTIKELFTIKSSFEHLLSILLNTPYQSEISDFKSVSGKSYRLIRKQNDFQKHLGNKIKFEQFIENSQQIISKWLTKQPQLELIIKNFFSVYGRKGVLVENRFLSYLSIVENYHRNSVSLQDTKYILSKYFKKVKFRKYKGIETPNFTQRIICIFHNSKILSNIDDLIKYVEIITNTRDFHTHLLDVKEKKSLARQEIVNANQLLEFIIREILLREIGITDFDQDLNALPIIKIDDLKFNK